MFWLTVLGLVGVAYLIGSIPFGWLVARARGIDIFTAGSGNIGATNVGRVLGRELGILVFLLDLAKGMIPPGLSVPILHLTADAPASHAELGPLIRVLTALATFLGHLFPIYLGMRGGKGIATGAGTVLVLLPGPAFLALAAWLTITVCTRTISLGSLTATLVLIVAHLLTSPAPFAVAALPITLYCLGGGGLIAWKHRANVQRLRSGTENRLHETTMLRTTRNGLHLFALSLWFGSAVFFVFLAAPPIFASFQQVVATAPNDRTAHQPLLTTTDTAERARQADRLASALAGAAVGPLFPRFFALSGLCAIVALLTAFSWLNEPTERRIHQGRVYVLLLAGATVAIGWPLSIKVAELRASRFHPDPAIAEAARAAFGEWHVVSLLLSMAMTVLVGIALLLALWMPSRLPVVSLSDLEEAKEIVPPALPEEKPESPLHAGELTKEP